MHRRLNDIHSWRPLSSLRTSFRRETKLDEDQKATVKYLKGFLEVEKRGKKGGWGYLYSPFAGTKMKIKHKKTKGKRTIALGRAEGVADCSPEEAAAYFFDYCSNIRNRVAYAKGDITRFEIFKDKGKVNEKVRADKEAKRKSKNIEVDPHSSTPLSVFCSYQEIAAPIFQSRIYLQEHVRKVRMKNESR